MTFGPRSAMGFFQLPMLADRGWDRTTFGLAMAIQNLFWGLGLPFFGAIADRYGTWRVLALGGVIYAAGLYADGDGRQPAMLHIGGGVLVGMGVAAGSFSHRACRLRAPYAAGTPLHGVRHRHGRRFGRHVPLRTHQPGPDHQPMAGRTR